ncbi:MAG TPA: hypothetical protein VK808_12375 [Bacteroidia bacterium]|nr:hypothetical protein [Bacteroidia bacterium]
MRSKIIHIIHAIVALIFSWVSLNAQQVQVNARIDSTSILIGNQAHIHLTVAYDAKNGVPQIQWPQIADSLVSKIEVISKTKISTVTDSAHPSLQQQTQDITISGFDSGYYAIPPFQFVINGDTEHALSTEAMMLQVNMVHVDTAKGIKDIKGPIQVPFNILEILPYIGYGLLIALALLALYYFIVRAARKQKPLIIEKPKVIIPPHVKALEELEKLALRKLWQEGKIKEYYTGITEILRAYIQERYGIGAPEMTTDEIMYALKRKDISELQKGKLRDILVLSDLVKFAKENPLPTEHESCFNASIDFVNETAESITPAAVVTPVQPTPTTNQI